MQLEKSRYLPTGKNPLHLAVGNHGQKILVITAHDLQSFQGGHFRRHGWHLGQRPHDALHAGAIPILPVHTADVVGGDNARGMVILRHEEATAAAVQQILIHEIAQADIAFHGAAIMLHDVADAAIAKFRAEPHLKITAAGGIKQKPSDKRHPKTAKIRSHEKAEQSGKDEKESYDLPNLRRPSRSAFGILGNPPKQGAQNPTPVERIPGNHVEGGQRNIGIPQPQRYRNNWALWLCTMEASREVRTANQYSSNDQTRQWSDDRNPELGFGVSRFGLDLRNSPQSEQGNGAHLQPA